MASLLDGNMYQVIIDCIVRLES